MTRLIGRFSRGAGAPFQALRYFFARRSLWKYAIAPFCISLTVFVLSFYFTLSHIGTLISWGLGLLFGQPTGFLYNFLFYTTSAVSYAVIIGFLVLITFLLINLLAFPFNALLAEKVMALETGSVYQHPNLLSWIKFNIRMLSISFLKTLIFLLVSALLFTMSFIPVLQVAAGAVGGLIIAFDCWDYGLELEGMGLKQRLYLFYSHFWELLGFGITVGFFFLIPGLNFFLLPIAVIGGTRLVHQLNLGGNTGH